MYVPFSSVYTICDFQSETKFVFSLHDTRMKFRTRTRIISFGMKTGITCMGTKINFVPVSCAHMKRNNNYYMEME